MKTVKILGIGSTLKCGNGIEVLKRALLTGQNNSNSGVSVKDLEEFVSLKRCRRMDFFTRMALLSTHLCLKDANIDINELDKTSTGIVLGTALGPQDSIFSYLDGMIDAGDSCVSSFAFTNSVHNMAASQISISLGIRGPIRTIVTFGYSTGSALQTAVSWIQNEKVKRVILILLDEYSELMNFVVKRMGGGSDRVKPFSKDCSYVCSKGSVAFVLGSEGDGYCGISSLGICLTTKEAAKRSAKRDMLFCAAVGKAAEFDLYRKIWANSPMVGAYSPLYGSFMTGIGIELAIAALTLRDETVYCIPGIESIKGIILPRKNTPKIKTAAVAGVSGSDRITLIELE